MRFKVFDTFILKRQPGQLVWSPWHYWLLYWEKFSCPFILSCDCAELTDHRGTRTLCGCVGHVSRVGPRRWQPRVQVENLWKRPAAPGGCGGVQEQWVSVVIGVIYYILLQKKFPSQSHQMLSVYQIVTIKAPILLGYLFREDDILFKKVGVIFYQDLKLKIKNKWWNIKCSVNMTLNETHIFRNNRHSVIYKNVT